MQEVTVRPRSTFRHFVTVDTAGKELVWNFGTKRKNISFGLFKQPPPQSQPALAEPAQPLGAADETAGGRLLLRAGPAATLKNLRKRGVSNPETFSTGNSPIASPSPSLRASVDLSASPLIELLPIAHYDSAKVTVKGSYCVTEPGTYVLVFDNSFSVNTSKSLFFFVALRDSDGMLDHSIEEGGSSVEQRVGMSRNTSNISAISARIVGGKKTVEGWILKHGNLKVQGFLKRWLVIDADGNLSYSKTQGGQIRGLVSLFSAAVRLDHDNISIVVDTGSAILHFKALNLSDFHMWVQAFQIHTSPPNFRQTAVSNEEELAEMQKLIGIQLSLLSDKALQIRRFCDKQSLAPSEVSNVSVLAEEINKGLADVADSQLRLFTKATSAISDPAFNLASNAIRPASAASKRPSAPRRESSLDESMLEMQFYDALDYDSEDSDDNENEDVELELKDGEVAVVKATRVADVPDARPRTDSATRIVVLDSEPTGNGLVEDPDDDDDSEAELYTIKSVSTNQELLTDSGENKSALIGVGPDKPSPSPPVYSVVRRTRLPAPQVSMENISVMSILRNNMGKDMSTIAMPVALNEPLNLLQKLAEELEYCELLDAAADAPSVVDRMVFVSAFAISGYASTVNRAGRKPFNPLLGETYECIRTDKGFKFISEKVSHHPPVMACYAEASKYVFYQDNLVKSKFWGKSMEFVPSGTVNVAFPNRKDVLQWSKVTTCMRNMFSGTRSLEHYGTMKILESNSTTEGYTSAVTFKEAGYFTSAKNEISATVFDPSGMEVAWLTGKWDEAVYRFEKTQPNNLEVIWRATPCPPHHGQMYGFTQFAVELNEITPDIAPHLPKTDTRYRPDQRWYEEGRADDAEAEKLRLEAKQRETRRRMEAAGQKWTPRWFREVDGEWKYNDGVADSGGYFEHRAQGNFGKLDIPDIF
ncbi:Oxysterol-binding protein- protein 3 [Entophlyctis sp. JEL0112]|nr:Oxysterol-binding protein- protein 3 [Entophlyctis sp. JEL0112]